MMLLMMMSMLMQPSLIERVSGRASSSA